MPNMNWCELNHMQLGRFAEYLVKMELTSYKFDVYTSEVDDHGIDFVMKNTKGTFFEVQVKSARLDRTDYVFMTKKCFDITSDRLILALVLFSEGKYPETYLIPANAWINGGPLFKDRDYIDGKSKPEWGFSFVKKNLPLLEPYSMTTIVEVLNTK